MHYFFELFFQILIYLVLKGNFHVCNSEFTLNDFRPDFRPPIGFVRLPTNSQIKGKSVLVHVSDNDAVLIIKDVI